MVLCSAAHRASRLPWGGGYVLSAEPRSALSVFLVCEKDLSQSCYISGQRKTCVVQAVFDLTAGLINPVVVVILNANLLHALKPNNRAASAHLWMLQLAQ